VEDKTLLVDSLVIFDSIYFYDIFRVIFIMKSILSNWFRLLHYELRELGDHGPEFDSCLGEINSITWEV